MKLHYRSKNGKDEVSLHTQHNSSYSVDYIYVLTLGKNSMNSVENNRRKSTAAICRSSSSIAALWTEFSRYVTFVSTGRLLYNSCKSMNMHTKVKRRNTSLLIHDSKINVLVISQRQHCTFAVNNSSCFHDTTRGECQRVQLSSAFVAS
jgi:hypothetical protein